MSENTNTDLGWCIVEMLGHRRLAGYVSEQELAGAGFLRVDIPGLAGAIGATQFVAPASIYALTPTTEEVARQVAIGSQPEPVSRWELPAGSPDEPNSDFEGDEPW